MTGIINIDVPRNGHYLREYRLCDNVGNPIDLTGATIESSARDEPGGSVVLATAAVNIIEPEDGRFELLWDGSDFNAYGSQTEIARATYDLKVTKAGISLIPMRGHLNILPENTA